MRLTATGYPREDQRAAFGDEIGAPAPSRASGGATTIDGEVEVVDRFQEREMGPAGQSRESGLLAVRDFFRRQEHEEIAIRAPLPFDSIDQSRTRGAHSRDAMA